MPSTPPPLSSIPTTPEELDARIAEGRLRIAFVGMSNSGKSHRARALRDAFGFRLHDIDSGIQQAMGLPDMDAMSAWLGYPSHPLYEEREREYLRHEEELTRRATMDTTAGNLVVDTTGSVVHLSSEALQELKESCLVVHLDVGPESVGQMIERFFAEPKPVAWGGFFSQEPGESEEEALRRSYPLLLDHRLKRYQALAQVAIPAARAYHTDGPTILALIKEHMPQAGEQLSD